MGQQSTEVDEQMADRKPPVGEREQQHAVVAAQRGPERLVDMPAPRREREQVAIGRAADLRIHDKTN
jgi:hypothetical protein